ncbi:hypothetical protein HMPREF9374_0536 [Desmospora sp. 8437]|nr:hypothetical protein HMPREF9374_0536 [Desmospora sp. 8437]
MPIQLDQAMPRIKPPIHATTIAMKVLIQSPLLRFNSRDFCLSIEIHTTSLML